MKCRAAHSVIKGIVISVPDGEAPLLAFTQTASGVMTVARIKQVPLFTQMLVKPLIFLSGMTTAEY